jgi:hypothetical protein
MERSCLRAGLLVPLALAFAAPGLADVRVTNQVYIRADGATDGVLASCSSDEPGTAAGGNRQQNEPSVAVRPGEPSFIVATANDYCTVPSFRDAWEGVYVSTNGGATWTDSLLPGYPGDTSAAGQASPLFGVDTTSGDPLVRWDTSGDLFVGGIAFNRTATTGAVQQANGNAFVATYVRDPKSPLGIAYVRTVIVGIGTPSPFTPSSGRFNDKPSLQVDNWSTSPNRGNVYMAWTLFPGAAGQDQIQFARSTDHGATFSRPIIVSKSVPNAQGSAVAVTPDGSVFVFWRQFASVASGVDSAIVFVKSTDGGRTFSDPFTVALTEGYDRQDVLMSGGFAEDCGSGPFACLSGFTFHRTGAFPQAVGDKHGNVFVTWEEVTPAPDNGDSYRPDGQSQVVFSRSTDGGVSWSTPAKVDGQPAGHQWWPDIAYDVSRDALALVYYDSREDASYSPFRPPGNLADGTSVCGTPVGSASCDVLNTFLATSSDQGASWSAKKVSSAGHQPEYEMFGGRRVPFHGDYLGIDAASGTVFGVWTDNRDVVPGTDPRETPDGFDVLQCRATPSSPDTCPNAGGLNQNIFGAALKLK